MAHQVDHHAHELLLIRGEMFLAVFFQTEVHYHGGEILQGVDAWGLVLGL